VNEENVAHIGSNR